MLGLAATHQAAGVELPLLVVMGAKPVVVVIAPLVLEATEIRFEP
jgi:hypothetical protein